MAGMDVTYFDADGAVVDDPGDAARFAATETDAAGRQWRHYGTVGAGDGPADEIANPDHADEEDWTKGTWDVYWASPDGPALVETLEQYASVAGFGTQPEQATREQLANFVTSPAWAAAPDTLRAEVAAYLERR